MKNSICIPAFFRGRSFEDSVRCIAHYGFHAAELWDWQDLDLQKSREALQENRVELVTMCTTEFRMTDPAFRSAWLQGLQRSCEAGAVLGTKLLITQVGPDTGEDRKKQHDSIVEALVQAGPVLEAYGLTLVIEPLNTLFDHPGYYLTSSKEGAEIVREAGQPRVRMLFDIYHQQIMEGNLIPDITEELDSIAHFHAAGHPGRHELESGEINYHRIFREIDRLGFTGYVGLEYFPEMAPEQSLMDFRRQYL